MKPTLWILLASALFVSPWTHADELKEIGSLMDAVTQSKSAESEAKNIEKVWRHIAKHRVGIQVFAKSAMGKEIDINSIQFPRAIKTVRIVFEKGDASTSIGWAPIESSNIFILFRE